VKYYRTAALDASGRDDRGRARIARSVSDGNDDTSERRAGGPVRAWAFHLARAIAQAASGYSRHALSALAAATAYRVLFSLVPLVAVLITLADLLLPDNLRTRLAMWAAGLIPGQTGMDESVDRALKATSVSTGVAGVIALGALLWTASGMMGSIRVGFRVIWEIGPGRPYARAKLLDFALVLATGIVAVAAFGLAIVVQVLAELGRQLATSLGANTGGSLVATIAQVVASVALTFLVLLLLHRTVPPEKPRLPAVWPAALLGAVAFNLTTSLYGVYLANFGSYTTIYGSLGALLGFLVVVYAGALVILIGAEVVAAWPSTGLRRQR
jgi:membrane protein